MAGPEENCQSRRRFLFLQGPIGPFFGMLADNLRRVGHQVNRINFNGGDRLFWRGAGAVDYRGGARDWPQFLARHLSQWGITDIVLFGDCRPLHRAASQLALLRGVPVHVFEEGYLRPNWVTLETGGVNKHSSMPRSAEWFTAAAASLKPWNPGQPVLNNFKRRAAEDVLYNLVTLLTAWAYPSYRSHKPWHPLAEYAAGAKRFPLKPLARRRKAALLGEIAARKQAYYLFPLQLDADSQIRFHSPFGRMAPAIERVIGSFARHAPRDALLIVTEHPLDTGLVKLQHMTREYALAAGVAERIVYLEGGSPDELVRNSQGVATVNSTMGILALTFGVPVVAMGHAIYDMPQLTFQGGLDRFWNEAQAPDAAAFDAFRRVVAVRTQVNGGFYSRVGLQLVVEGAGRRLAAANHKVFPAPVREYPGIAGESPCESIPGLAAGVWDDAEAISK